jgi:hypothetical protein
MAVPTIAAVLEINYEVTSDYSNDGVSEQQDILKTATKNFPKLLITGDDTISSATGKLKWQCHGDNTIGAGATLTIDFTTQTDRLTGTVIGAGGKVLFGCVALQSPDGTKKIRVGPNNDAAAVTFGMSPVSAYQDRTVDFTYDEPYTGSSGDKILIKNPGGSTIDVSWSFAGG